MMKKLILFLALMTTGKVALAQFPVRAQLTLLPPYSTDLSAYASNPNQVVLSLVNQGSEIRNVQLVADITGDNGIAIRSMSQCNCPGPIRLQPWQTLRVQAADIASLFDMNNMQLTGISREELIRRQGLPEGLYQVCIRAIDYLSKSPLSEEAGGCTALFLRNLEPPVLVSPADESVLNPLPVQNVLFSWITPAGAPPSTRYVLKIVELFNDRNPNDALLSAAEPAFFEQVVQGNAYLFGPGQPRLVNGRKYAVMISAKDPTGRTFFRNNGNSQVIGFQYGGEQLSGTANQMVVKENKARRPVPGEIPTIRVKGRLQWSFRKTEENAPGTLAGEVLAKASGGREYAAMLFDPGAANGVQAVNQVAKGVVNQKLVTQVVARQDIIKPAVAGKSTTPGSSVFVGSNVIGVYVTAAGQAAGSRAEFERLAGDVKYPMRKTVVRIYAASSKKVGTGSFLGAGTSDEEGNFDIMVIDPAHVPDHRGRDIVLRYENPYFTTSDLTYTLPAKLSATGDFQTGDIRSLANTYRFKVSATDAENKKSIGVSAEIYRPSEYYGNHPDHRPEGSLLPLESRETEVINGRKYVKVAIASNRQMAGMPQGVATRLFHTLYFGDHYFLKVSAEGYEPYFTKLEVSPGYSELKNQVITVERSFSLARRPSVIEGKVTLMQGGVTMNPAGVMVSLKLNDDSREDPKSTQAGGVLPTVSRSRAASTVPALKTDFVHDLKLRLASGTISVRADSNGYYRMENVPVSSKPYVLTAAVPGSPASRTETVSVVTRGLTVRKDILIENQVYEISGTVTDRKGTPLNEVYVGWKGQGNGAFTDKSGKFSLHQANGPYTLTVGGGSYEVKDVPVNVSGRAVALGNIPLTERNGRLLIMVSDSATGNPLSGAGVTVSTGITEWLSEAKTNSLGSLFLEKAGDLKVVVKAPADSRYTGKTVLIKVESGSVDTTKLRILLAPGVRVSGTVRSEGRAAEGVRVSSVLSPDIYSLTDGSGKYTLYMPRGSVNIIASKSGLLSQEKLVSAAQDLTVDFDLRGFAFNAGRLLGFETELDKVTEGADGTKIISGALINLPPNQVFSFGSNQRLVFREVPVRIVNGAMVPQRSTITLQETTLETKAFSFLPLRVSPVEGNFLTLNKIKDNSGEIAGKAAIDFAIFRDPAFAAYLPDEFKYYVTKEPAVPGRVPGVTVAVSDAGHQATRLYLSGTGGQKLSVYGFEVIPDLPATFIRQDGVHFKGNLNLRSIPLIGNTSFMFEDLWLGADGKVKSASLDLSKFAGLKLAAWEASVAAASLGTQGLSLDGEVRVPLPVPGNTAVLRFEKLRMGKDMLFGGLFTIPSSGIGIADICRITPGRSPLSFGRKGTGNVYYLSGSAGIHFSKFLGSFELQSFGLYTDKTFSLQAPVNKSVDFEGIAKMKINTIGVRTAGTPGIDVNADVSLDLPMVKAAAGGLHFSSGGRVSIDELAVGFDIAGIGGVNVKAGFVDQQGKKGFSGSGDIGIGGLPKLSVGFGYYKVGNGIEVSSKFTTGPLVMIPIGTYTLNNIGGEVSFNTARRDWGVRISGNLGFSGSNMAMQIRDLGLKVSNGPVFRGDGYLNISSVLDVGKAEVVIDFPKMGVSGSFQREVGIPVLGSSYSRGMFGASGQAGSEYIVAGFSSGVNVAGIIKNEAAFVAGWGFTANEVPGQRHVLEQQYAGSNGKFAGVYLKVFDMYDFNRNLRIGPLSFGAKFFYQRYVYMNLGINQARFNLKAGGKVAVGGHTTITVMGKDFGTSVNGSLEGTLAGGYTGGQGLEFGAMLGATFDTHVGTHCDGCHVFDVCMIGAKICVRSSCGFGFRNGNFYVEPQW